MRLYLIAESKNHIGYTPDWLKVSFKENDEDFELTLDIRGEIDYEIDCLCCRCKGDLIPWVLWNLETGEEIDFGSLSEEECENIFPLERIAKIICESNSYEIGIYPTNNEFFTLAEQDIINNCKGLFVMSEDSNNYEKHFEFKTELNV